MRIQIGMGLKPCPTCGSLSNHTPGSVTCWTLRAMEAESKVAALQEAVRQSMRIMNFLRRPDNYPWTCEMDWRAMPAVAEALKGGGE